MSCGESFPSNSKETSNESHFNVPVCYYLLLCMNYDRNLNNQINSVHERALRLVYNDFKSSFHQLLEKGNSVTIHQRNQGTLAIEMFKDQNNIAPEVMKDVVKIKNHQYNFRRDVCLQCSIVVNTFLYVTETIASLEAQVWNLVCEHLNCSKSFNKFKKNI